MVSVGLSAHLLVVVPCIRRGALLQLHLLRFIRMCFKWEVVASLEYFSYSFVAFL